MYTSVPSPPLSSPTSPSIPSTRLPSRLRGLSYLLSRDHNHRPSSTLTRATSYPASSSPASPNTPTQQRFATESSSPVRASNTEPSASAWVPAPVDAAARLASQPHSSNTSSANSLTAVNSAPAGPMARTRSATVGEATSTPEASETQSQSGANANGDSRGMAHQLPSIRFSAHQAPGAQRPSLVFSPMARILPTGKEIIKVGRYSERDMQPHQAANVPSSAPVGFKSKVVSRRHCEFWYSGGKWYIKDVKSSSGTFLNHIRLSSPGTESRPFPVNDGDIVQLGIDFKGGEEMIFRCVKIRVELNKGWQTGPSSFNVQSHKRLRELNSIGKPAAGGGSSQDCSICLGSIAPCQSLFVAPCSHTWHYKCIRVIINGPMFPHFVCPNCRSVADLEAELDDPYANGEEDWEEVPPELINETTQTPDPVALGTQRTEHIIDATEESILSAAAVELPTGGVAVNSRHENSDLELPENSDSENRSIGPESPLASSDHLPLASSSTVPAVDIQGRRSISEPSTGTLSHLQRSVARPERSDTRTPSPNGLPSSLTDGIGHEGPMTPRNDVGPFIFDGSAGRVGASVAPAVNLNMNEVADATAPRSHLPSPPA